MENAESALKHRAVSDRDPGGPLPYRLATPSAGSLRDVPQDHHPQRIWLHRAMEYTSWPREKCLKSYSKILSDKNIMIILQLAFKPEAASEATTGLRRDAGSTDYTAYPF